MHDFALPSRAKVRGVVHHAALPYVKLPEFMQRLTEQAGVAALALRFAVLTAGRTGEVIGARWDEIDFAERLWTVPGERMKAGREHRVPLSDAALAIIEEMRKIRQAGDFVFPGSKAKRPAQAKASPPAAPTPAPGLVPEVAAPLAQKIQQEVDTNLDSLKDTLLRIELRRQAGTISDEEYARERGRAEQVLRDLVQD